MRPAVTKYRLCVDVDHQGQPLGISVEAAEEDWGSPERIWVGRPGPFDTREEALRACWQWVVDTHGVPMRLFD